MINYTKRNILVLGRLLTFWRLYEGISVMPLPTLQAQNLVTERDRAGQCDVVI